MWGNLYSNQRKAPTRENIMDWKLFGMTFFTLFLAEFGDKTQLMAMSLGAQYPDGISYRSVLLGVLGGLTCAGLFGAFLGKILSGWLSPHWVQIGAGFLFILIGTFTLWKAYVNHS